MNDQDMVEAGYDRMAEQYLRAKDYAESATMAALEQLVDRLPQGGRALDLGCGAGVPALRWLAAHVAVTGVDVSARQLELAHKHVPAATLVKASMTEVEFDSASFDAVIALYSIIHVPRTEQPALLRSIHRWLKPGGVFLATWAVSEWEGTEDNWEGWGAAMWWSHYNADTNRQMLRDAGFHIESAETRTSNGETWLWIAART